MRDIHDAYALATIASMLPEGFVAVLRHRHNDMGQLRWPEHISRGDTVLQDERHAEIGVDIPSHAVDVTITRIGDERNLNAPVLELLAWSQRDRWGDWQCVWLTPRVEPVDDREDDGVEMNADLNKLVRRLTAASVPA